MLHQFANAVAELSDWALQLLSLEQVWFALCDQLFDCSSADDVECLLLDHGYADAWLSYDYDYEL